MKKILICSFLVSFVSLVVLTQVGYGDVPKPGAAEMQQKIKDINSKKPIDPSLVKDVKVISLKKGLKWPILDLNKMPVDFRKMSPPPKEKKVVQLVSVMSFPQSQDIATRFEEMSSYLYKARDEWYKSFTTIGIYPSIYGVTIVDYNGQPSLFFYTNELWHIYYTEGNWPWRDAFQNVIQDVIIAEANARHADKLLNKFDRLPNLSEGEKQLETLRSDVKGYLAQIRDLHIFCQWLFTDVAPNTKDQTVIITGVDTDPGKSFDSMAKEYEGQGQYFRDYYTKHNLPH